MNINQLIYKAFNKRLKPVKNENEYNPSVRVQSTVKPSEKASYNEVFENINKQLKLEV